MGRCCPRNWEKAAKRCHENVQRGNWILVAAKSVGDRVSVGTKCLRRQPVPTSDTSLFHRNISFPVPFVSSSNRMWCSSRCSWRYVTRPRGKKWLLFFSQSWERQEGCITQAGVGDNRRREQHDWKWTGTFLAFLLLVERDRVSRNGNDRLAQKRLVLCS